MKILLVGSAAKGALEKYYYKYIKDTGVDVELFDCQTPFYQYYNKGLLNKVLYRSGFSLILNEINISLLNHVEQSCPDVIVVFKGMEIFPGTVKKIAARGARIVNFNPDSPFIFSGRGSGNKNVTNSITLYHAHISYNKEIIGRLEKMNMKTYWLPFGYDLSEELYKTCLEQEEVGKACFVGNPDVRRVDFFNQLAGLGILIDIYGNSWNRFTLHKNIAVYNSVYDESFWKVLHRYRAQLNILRPHNINSHAMRSFEIPGAGGIQITYRTVEHEFFFRENSEAFFFETVQDCAKMVKILLKKTPEEIKEVRLASRHRCVDSGYSYASRTIQLLKYLKTL